MITTSQTMSAQNLILNNIFTRSSSVSDEKKEGFELIWYYWFLKNFSTSNKPTRQSAPSSLQQTQQPVNTKPSPTKATNPAIKPHQPSISQPQSITLEQPKHPITLHSIQTILRPYKQTYHLQTIEPHLQHNLNAIKQRALLSRNDRFFVIEPEQEIQQIQRLIRGSSITLKNGKGLETCLEDMVIELYSYYLNSKNVYLIYKGTGNQGSLLNTHYENNSISSSIDSTENRLKMILTHNSSQSRLNTTSKDSKGSLKNHERNQRRSYGSLKSSLVMPNGGNTHVKLLQEDSILMLGGTHNPNGIESLVGEGDNKMENKIEEMEVVEKLGEFDGMELWNIKYKKVPHTFVKFKKQSWTKCLNLPIMHPSSPKTINEFPIIPRLCKLHPSIDKLIPFVSFIKLLQKYFPNLLPSIDSIFQYNNLPYIFLEEDNGYGSWKWETNIGVLCYFVVYGNDEDTLSIKKVERWVEQNPETLLARTIKEMVKRQKEKNKKRKDVVRGVVGGNNTSSNNNTSNTNVNNSSNKDNKDTHINNNSNTQNQNSNPSDSTLVNSSLQMLITRDQNSDLAIW